MNSKKSSIRRRLWAMFASFLVFIGLLTGVETTIISSQNTYAVEGNDNSSQQSDTNSNNNGSNSNSNNSNNSNSNNSNSSNSNSGNSNNTNANNSNNSNNSNAVSTSNSSGDNCKNSLGALGWLVCPTTGKISEAVDWLYEKIEEFLVISPVSAQDGTPIYEIWKYCRGITNIVFIIFLLVVIYSQITGLGISNYGIKKVLPKLIVTVIMVNLSFLIWQLAVDVSNIIGGSLRGLFTSVEQSTLANSSSGVTPASLSNVFLALTGGAPLAIGATMIAFDSAMIWMLIPVALGAIVAVVTGLITIALRQAIVVLLIMISPLAMVANMLPNTEQWFRKWKNLLMKMLIFYPMFSLLFGASSLAGFAIIMSATDGFGLMLGIAVQIFPLFFAWSLMKMSGTILGTINSKLNGLASGAVSGARTEAAARRALMQKKNMLRKPYTPSLKLMQFMNDQRVVRDEKMKKYDEAIRNRALAKYSMTHYNKDGSISRKGEEDYELQKRNLRYQQVIAMDNNNFNRGLAGWSKEYKGTIAGMKRDFDRSQGAFSPQIKGVKLEERLKNLDNATVLAADDLKVELARGEKIEFDNAAGFHKRMEDAMNAHMDMEKGFVYNEDGSIKGMKKGYKFHFRPSTLKDSAELARYNSAYQIMEGSAQDVQYAAATAAQGYDTQNKIYQTKMQKYFEMTAPTKDVYNRLTELTNLSDKELADKKKATDNIDAIIAGLRVLNQRGDTDLVREQIENLLGNGEGVELGTHASQALASFLMFEVKDSDPFLRRFGKYINLETAHIFNENEKHPEKMRKNKRLSLKEYVTGEFEDYVEDEWEFAKDKDGKILRKFPKRGKSKKSMVELIEGTSLDNVERTAYGNLDEMLMKAYSDENGKNLDAKKYLDKREEIETAIGPAFISASLKYLSGSEQIKNAVSFITGYDDKGVGRWEDDGDMPGNEEAKKYFRRKTIEYLKNQTPTQLLSLRSDYYASLSKHLLNEYEESKMKDWSDEAIAEREELMKEKEEIPNRYADLPEEDATKKRAEDMKDLRERMIGAQFRQILDSRGKLNQIYRTRRSGAANNAKDWLRKWLDLDNEALINLKLNADREKRNEELRKLQGEKKKAKPTESDSAPVDTNHGRIYDELDKTRFTSYIDDLFHDVRDDDDDAFYNESLDYVKKNLGKDSYIAEKYEEYRKDDPTADSHVLKEVLMDLLSDIDNYY